MSVPNLFDADARRRMRDLYGEKATTMPTRAEYQEQLRKWCDLADKQLTPAELEAVIADQDRRVATMGKK